MKSQPKNRKSETHCSCKKFCKIAIILRGYFICFMIQILFLPVLPANKMCMASSNYGCTTVVQCTPFVTDKQWYSAVRSVLPNFPQGHIPPPPQTDSLPTDEVFIYKYMYIYSQLGPKTNPILCSK